MKRRLAAVLCALCLFLPLAAATARADFGDYAGDYDYDYSYDYDYDYDDYDSGSDWDDDDDDDWAWSSSGSTYGGGGGGYYSSGGYSGGYSGGSSYSGGTTYHYYSTGSSYSPGYGVSHNGGTILWLVFLVLLVLLFIWLVNRAGNRADDREKARRQESEHRESVQNRPQVRPIGEYSAVDPNFSARELCQRAANLYVRMQNAWTDKDISELRPFFTDGFFTQMERTLEGIVKRGRTNYVERIAVMDVTPRGFHQTAGEDHVLLRLRARIVDYTVDDATGQVVAGHKDREKFMTYEWDLMRPTGVTTPADEDGVRHVNCPNCGAPLEINTSARCPYCGSVLEAEGSDWVICAIHGVSQQTM